MCVGGGNLLRREDDHLLRWTLEFGFEGHWGEGRPKRTRKKLVGEESGRVGVSREDVFCRPKCIVDVNLIGTMLRFKPPLSCRSIPLWKRLMDITLRKNPECGP